MKYLLTALLSLILTVSVQAQDYTRNGKEFSKTTVKAQSTDTDRDTGFTYRDSKGESLPIYMSRTGSCYVIRTSKKTGKTYRAYLGYEISSQICAELGVEYKHEKPVDTD